MIGVLVVDYHLVSLADSRASACSICPAVSLIGMEFDLGTPVVNKNISRRRLETARNEVLPKTFLAVGFGVLVGMIAA